jgi:hypothetical protein
MKRFKVFGYLGCAAIIVIKMFDLIYGAFFILMIAEMVLFLVLNLPFPKSFKKGILLLSESPMAKTFLKVQLVLCLLVIIFYVDLNRT